MGQHDGFEPQDPNVSTQETAHRYQVIVSELVAELRTGRYPPGALLPSNAQICQRWAVSTSTSRKVLAELARQGWARPQGTRGYIALPEPEAPEIGTHTQTQPDYGSHDPAAAYPPPPSHRTTIAPPPPQAPPGRPYHGPRPPHTIPIGGDIPPELAAAQHVQVLAEPAPPDVAHALQLPGPGQPVTVRRRVITDAQGALPIELRASYLHPATAHGTPLADPTPIAGPWHQALTRHTGRPLATADSAILARPPLAHEAAALQLPPGAHVLIRATTTRDRDGTPIDYTVSIWPADSTRISAHRHALT